MDNKQRIAIIETFITNNNTNILSPSSRFRYQLTDHLGSSVAELDENANIISFEEYYPFGGISYHSVHATSQVSQKRYRYCGKEKDEETGLYYYGARYYASCLGRWTSTDPMGKLSNENMFVFSRNNPINRVDNEGLQDEPAKTGEKNLGGEPSIQDLAGKYGFEINPETGRFKITISLSEKDVGLALSSGKAATKEKPTVIAPPEPIVHAPPLPGIKYEGQACFPDERYVPPPETGFSIPPLRYTEREEPKISADSGGGIPVKILTEKELIRAQADAKFEQRRQFEMARDTLTGAYLFVAGDVCWTSKKAFIRCLEAGSSLSGLLSGASIGITGKQPGIQRPGGFKEVADRQTASQEATSQLQRSAEKEIGKTELNIRRFEEMELKEYKSIKRNE